MIDRLTAELNIRIVLTGGSSDVTLNREIGQGRDNILDITGQCGLRTLSEIFRRASVVICPDTGPMHLIAAAGCPILVLFSAASDPALCAPRGANVAILRRDDLATLTVDAVLAALPTPWLTEA